MQPPPTPGYSPETRAVCKVGTEYETSYKSGLYRNLLGNVATEYYTSIQTVATANLLSNNATDYGTYTGSAYIQTPTCTAGTEYYYELQT
jgi:hypothetical protein